MGGCHWGIVSQLTLNARDPENNFRATRRTENHAVASGFFPLDVRKLGIMFLVGFADSPQQLAQRYKMSSASIQRVTSTSA